MAGDSPEIAEDQPKEVDAASGTRPSAVTSFGEDDFSIFPPSLHEGLTPSRTLTLAQSLNHHKANDDEDEEAHDCHVRWRRRFLPESAVRLIGPVVELVRSKIGGGGCWSSGGVVWSFAMLASLAGVLIYMRRRHWRERQTLLLLILDKDRKIAQLMQQVKLMNEVISSRPRVSIPKSS